MLLATDLDGTFLGGTSLQKQKLYRLLRKNKSICLIFVTGRGLESVIPLLNDLVIPNPDYIICDVGATVVNGYTLELVEPLQTEIKKNWPGIAIILERLKDLIHLQYQQVPQQRRCSFFTNDESTVEEVKQRAEEIGCDAIYSANKFLDVLPRGVNKGTTLINLVKHLKENTEDVLVAGDTLNDLAMYQHGFKGVVVGNAEQKLIEETIDIPRVYHAKKEGAGGVIEAMKYFLFLSNFAEEFDKDTMQSENSEAP